MRKLYIVIFIFITCNSYSQNLFFVGEKSYPSTSTFILKSNSDDFDWRMLGVSIAKHGDNGLLVLSTSSHSVLIKGKILVYLDDGTVISCIDRGKYDHVDNKAITIYHLTSEEISKLRKSNINTVRYSLKCGNCSFSTEEGNFSASNKYDGFAPYIHREAVNVPEMVEQLFK